MVFEILGVLENKGKHLFSLDSNLFCDFSLFYCEFMIDCRSLQQRGNVTYESIIHNIFIFSVCCNKEIMQPMDRISIVSKDSFIATKR